MEHEPFQFRLKSWGCYFSPDLAKNGLDQIESETMISINFETSIGLDVNILEWEEGQKWNISKETLGMHVIIG